MLPLKYLYNNIIYYINYNYVAVAAFIYIIAINLLL